MDLYQIPTDVLLFDLVMYGCLPLWLIMGSIDYWCHRKSKIETTTGIKESIYHAIMGVQVGIPVFLGLYFEINVTVFLIMFLVLIFHEWVAHHDVAYAANVRKITILEVHVHSFLEVLPFIIVALIAIINWHNFVDFITFNWSGHMGIELKQKPISSRYITGYFAMMMIADVAPFCEELLRCWRNRHLIKPRLEHTANE